VGPRAVLYTVVKRKIPSACRESNPRIPVVHSVAHRYIDLQIIAQIDHEKLNDYQMGTGGFFPGVKAAGE
jgi:hypothetical protein